MATSKTTWRDRYPIHEAADLFPLLEGELFNELVENIKRYGLRDPIVRTVDDKILDGRNRLRACLAADITPRFSTFRGPGKAFQYVISVNLHRRHLDTSQRAMIAAQIATLENGQRASAMQNCIAQPEAAALLNVSLRSVANAKKVLKNGTPKQVAAVRAGKIKVDKAVKQVTEVTKPKPSNGNGTPAASSANPFQLGAAMRHIGDVARAEWARCPKAQRPDFLQGLQQLRNLLAKDPKPIIVTLGRVAVKRKPVHKHTKGVA